MRLFRRKKKDDELNAEDDMSLVVTNTEDTAVLNVPAVAVDNVRQMITRIMRGEQLPRRLAIVSALRGEGVTYLAQSVASVIANDLAVNVCLVDLNWWAPSNWAEKLGVEDDGEAMGLAGVLKNEIALDDAVLPTGWDNLFILPAGKLAGIERPVMARSDELKAAIDELYGRFDYLVLDIPAILSTSDAVPLASLADACCLVIHQGVTSIDDVKNALDEIDHLTVLGTVLNNEEIATPSFIVKLIPQK